MEKQFDQHENDFVYNETRGGRFINCQVEWFYLLKISQEKKEYLCKHKWKKDNMKSWQIISQIHQHYCS